MGIRHPKREELARLECKTLDAQFRTTVQEGLGCSPFEARAVLEVVHEVYDPYLKGAASGQPSPKRKRGSKARLLAGASGSEDPAAWIVAHPSWSLLL